MWRLGCLSLLAAGVAILLHVWLMRENQVKSRLSCSDRNQPEKSVCYGENICYSKLDKYVSALSLLLSVITFFHFCLKIMSGSIML